MQRSDEYRLRAAEAVKLAATTDDSRSKAVLLSIANGWIKLARLIEVYRPDRSPFFKPPAENRSRKAHGFRGRH
jgi:hypothetical protein